MADKTISLVLNGEVFIEDFADAVGGWMELIRAISDEDADGDRVRWSIQDAAGGSFQGTLRAVCDPAYLPVADRLSARYVRVGKDTRQNRLGRYSPRIKNAVSRISQVIGRGAGPGTRGVQSYRFESDIDDAEVFVSPKAEPKEEGERPSDAPTDTAEGDQAFVMKFPDSLRASYGSVRGKIESLMGRNQLRFTLYEINTDRAVSCYCQAGSESIMRDAWGKLAIVEGMVQRDPQTGLVTTVRQVKAVIPIAPSDPAGYRAAFGCAPAMRSNDSPEAAIRRLRDAQ